MTNDDNTLMKAKKNITSKVARVASSAETIIKKAVGDEGFDILENLLILLKSVLPREQIKKWKIDLYRLVFKFNLLVKEKKVSQKEKTDLTDPFQNYILGIYSILEMHFAGDKEKHSNAIDDFLVVREIFIKALLAVLAGKIKPTNIEAFREVLQVVNKTEILQMSSLEQNKDAVKKISEKIKLIVEPIQIERKEMEEHETKRSNHVFSDHYSFAIQTCRGIWRAAEASCEPANLGNAIIDIFVAKAPEYPKQVAALPMGADREQRGKVVFTHVRDVINMLELWDKVIPSVKTWRATVHKHEQNLGSRLAMRDFGEAVIEGIEKSSKARLKQGDKKRMYILMDIIVRESFEGSSV